MTTIKRRPKPTSTTPEPWPSYTNPEPRVTTSGKVSSLPSPIQAMWAEVVGRARIADDGDGLDGEVEGLCVALSILTCSTLDEVRREVNRRTHVSVSRSGAGS